MKLSGIVFGFGIDAINMKRKKKKGFLLLFYVLFGRKCFVNIN